jgi:outer membrane protein OmpA-like peptidoglycan-associated protein
MRPHLRLAAAAWIGLTGAASADNPPEEYKSTTETKSTTEPKESTLYFGFDSDKLPVEADMQLTDIVKWAKCKPKGTVMIDAHTDVRGTPNYNLGLSIRRGEQVQAKLISRGVPANRIVVSAFGEDQASATQDPKDRRVHIRTTSDTRACVLHRRQGTALVLPAPTAPEAG